MNETIKDIRKRCRAAMNGVASTSMRTQGLNYKLNFGVPVLQIREISSRYKASKELAELLWQDGTRELKILATLLYPIEEFSETTANSWVAQIPNQEIREQICINLLQKLSYADTSAILWANNDSEDIRATGYWLLSRRMLTKSLNQELKAEDLNYIWDDILSENVSLKNAANLFLKNMGKISAHTADNILRKLDSFKDSEEILKKEIYESMAFEFEFHHGTK